SLGLSCALSAPHGKHWPRVRRAMKLLPHLNEWPHRIGNLQLLRHPSFPSWDSARLECVAERWPFEGVQVACSLAANGATEEHQHLDLEVALRVREQRTNLSIVRHRALLPYLLHS